MPQSEILSLSSLPLSEAHPLIFESWYPNIIDSFCTEQSAVGVGDGDEAGAVVSIMLGVVVAGSYVVEGVVDVSSTVDVIVAVSTILLVVVDVMTIVLVAIDV